MTSPVPEADRSRSEGPAPPRGPRLLFPRGVRPWHLIVLPALMMGLLISGFRLAEHLLGAAGVPTQGDAYEITRTVAITVAMASLIAWLALRYHTEFEEKLQARNAALQSTRDFLAGIIQGSGEAIITLDHEERVTSWNSAAEKIYGWTAGEMVGQDLGRLLPAGSAAAEEEERNQRLVRAGETLRHYETERVHRDGRRIVVHVTQSPLYDPHGEFRGSIVILHDVTHLRELQGRLREKERLAAVGQLAATVAHEVKNPLAGIRGACEIMAQRFDEGEPQKDLCREVLRQVDRLNRTVEDLLVFARPKAKQPVTTDLHLLINRVIGLMGDAPEHKQVTLRREFEPSLPAVEVDPQQIEQVLLNLLLNAYQAVDQRGNVTVRTGTNGSRVVIRVIDDGPGVSEEIRQRMFEPFFTTRTRGTGLGLAIVRNIVHAHGGEIHVEDAPGRGTDVVVELPWSR